jgi:murein DD-endopeptidase MepM/ murein hydrolase activator NlpD
MQKPLADRPPATLTDRLGHGLSRDIHLRSGTNEIAAGDLGVGRATHWMRLWLAAHWADDLLMSRTTAHVAVILLLLLVIGLSGVLPFTRPAGSAPWGVARLPKGQEIPQPTAEQNASPSTSADHPLVPVAPLANGGDILMRAAVPHTIIPERPRDEVTHYTVQSGDTIFGIAAQFGLAPETIMWANGRLEDNPDLLRVGQELVVLPINGVYHQVGAGDTIEKIAAAFKADPAAIINYSLNGLNADNPQLTVGQWLVVPGGTKPYIPRTVVAYNGPIPDNASKGTGTFGWPAAGRITQGYWDRHRAVDIGAWKGAPALAADSGYVVAAGCDKGGCDTGYGRMVVIDHGNGFQTLYGHLQVFFVQAGDSVAKGQKIGEVGSTGNSTGPHLHFEVRQNGVQRNPFGFLP